MIRGLVPKKRMENEGFRLRTLHEKSHEPIVYIGLLRASNLLGLVLLTGYPLPFVRILSIHLTFQGINKKIEQHEVWPWSPSARDSVSGATICENS